MNKNIPNILTFTRILIVPILLASYYIEGRLFHLVAAGLFLFASITDFFDGYLARTFEAQSRLGKLLDPIADKLLVATAIVILIQAKSIGKYDIIPITAILCREFFVSGLREFLSNTSVSIPVSKLAKIKTAMQMTALFLLLLGVEGPNVEGVQEVADITLTELLGRVFLWISAGLTLVTGYAYFKQSVKHI